MRLEKLNCPACGAPLQPKPGLDRVTCSYCGCTYRLRNTSEKTAGRSTGNNSQSAAAYRDNPADVELIPVPMPVIDLGDFFAPKFHQGYPIEKQTGKIVDAKYPNVEIVKKEQDGRVRFLAMVSLLRQESYQMKGRLILNIVPKYLPGKAVETDPLTSDEIKQLREPSVIYYPHKNIATYLYSDCLKKDGYVNTTAYTSGDAKWKRQKILQDAETLVKPYGFSVSAQGKVTRPSNEVYGKDDFFHNQGKKHYRTWATEYTEEKVSLKITPAYAEKLLSPKEKEQLTKIGSHEIINVLAEEFSAMLNRGYQKQLEIRKSFPVRLIVKSDGIGLGDLSDLDEGRTILAHFFQPGSALDKRDDAHGLRRFKEFGMSDLQKMELRLMVAAQLLARILAMTDSEGTDQWYISEILPEIKTFGNSFLTAVKLTPAAKTKGVYNDWV